MTQTARPSESTAESDSAASALSNWRAEEKEKAPWEEGWRICWTIGKQEPVLHTGGSVMPFNPGGR